MFQNACHPCVCCWVAFLSCVCVCVRVCLISVLLLINPMCGQLFEVISPSINTTILTLCSLSKPRAYPVKTTVAQNRVNIIQLRLECTWERNDTISLLDSLNQPPSACKASAMLQQVKRSRGYANTAMSPTSNNGHQRAPTLQGAPRF